MNHVALRPADPINVLSICTGGGGLDLGFELAVPSARSVCMVEREAFAAAQLVSAMEAGHLAPAPIWSDARTFDGRAWRGSVDGLIGGIPCQPHSLAGKRLERQDERDLWSTARRIIVQSGAWFVLIENVRGMVSSGGAERVWGDLRRLGFAVECGLFSAAEVGAPHERERFFILAVADARYAQRRTLAAGRHDSNGYQAGRDESADRIGKSGPHGVGLADANRERLEGIGTDAGAIRRENARRPAGLCDGTDLVDTPRFGRGEGRAEPIVRSGRDTTASAGDAMDDASIARGRGIPVLAGRQEQAGPDTDGAGYRNAGAGLAMADPKHQRSSCARIDAQQVGTEFQSGDGSRKGIGLFPPRPDDLSGWRDVLSRSPELEPAFRRVADGLASRLDIARVDRLRLLGNGVVPLEAGYGVRTLATRLAARGSAGAALLAGIDQGTEEIQ